MELLLKLVPLTVKTNAASPAVLLVGEMLLSVGTGLLTRRLAAADVPPPGVGLKTVIGNEPAAPTSAAVNNAVNCVELTNAVARLLPLRRTTELLTKFVPLTVSINAASPAVLLAGKRLEIAGIGLSTVKILAFEVPPPGAKLKTVIGNIPVA